MTGDERDAALILLPAASTVKAAGDRFTGDVGVDAITQGALPGTARLATVRFSPSARTAWHRHALGQTLHVTDGQGLVQAKAGQLILMCPGDTVYTAPGVWHWHGALPDYFMTHLALADSAQHTGVPDVEWGDLVIDAEYNAATTMATTMRMSRKNASP
jgi:quercetin dioxygenase-like cupin family protein